MRKYLFILIIILLLVFTGIVLYKGTNLGNVWGYTQIRDKNTDIDNLNANLTKLVNQDYPTATKRQTTSSETLQETKKEYEQQAVLVANNKYYNQVEKYKIEFLLTKFGNYGQSNDVDVKLDVSSSGITDLYNLTLTVTGRYKDVTGFIYDLENDSKLGFKVEDFKMTDSGETINSEDGKYYSAGKVSGKFTFKEVGIDLKSVDGNSASLNVTNNNTTNNSENNTENNTQNNTVNNNQTNTTTQNGTGTNTTPTTNTTQSTNTTNNNTTNTTTNTTSGGNGIFREIPNSQEDLSNGDRMIDNAVGNTSAQ